MPAPQRNSKAEYKKHKYCGARKTKIKIQAGLSARGILATCRQEMWRKEMDAALVTPETVQNPIASSSTLKTYSRPKPSVRLEALFQSNETNSLPEIAANMPKNTKTPKLYINWPQPDPATEAHELQIEAATNDNFEGLSGYRIMDVKHVLEWALALGKHAGKCEGSQIELLKETSTGLHSEFLFQCSMCGKKWNKANEEEKNLNKSFVWGSVTAGSYYTQASHIISIMDIPTISDKMFRHIEIELGEVWEDWLTEEIIKAGEMEKAIAIEKGQIEKDGTPYTKVYIDGGWLKRSYGHNSLCKDF